MKENEFIDQMILGDSLEKMSQLPDNSIDCCIADPPYNISGYDDKKQIGWLKSNKYWTEDKKFDVINADWDKYSDLGYEAFTYKWLEEVARVVKPNGNIAIFGSYHNIYKIGSLIEKMDLRIINSLVWYKRNAFPNITQRMFCESTEYIIWATNGSKKKAKNWTFNYDKMKELNGGKQMRNMFDIPTTKTSERKHGKHPSQKPLELIQNLVLALTNEEDLILDPFIGSGTTALAAALNNRHFVGYDISSEYLEIALRRLEEIEVIA